MLDLITLASLNGISAQKNIWYIILDVMEERYPRYQRLIDSAREELELINLSTFTAETLESVPVIFFSFIGEDTEKVCMFYIQALAIVVGCSYMHKRRSLEPIKGLNLTLPLPIDGVSPVVAVDISSVLKVASVSGHREDLTLAQNSPGLEVLASLLTSRDLFHAVFCKHGLCLPGVRLGQKSLRLWLLRGNIIFYFS